MIIKKSFFICFMLFISLAFQCAKGKAVASKGKDAKTELSTKLSIDIKSSFAKLGFKVPSKSLKVKSMPSFEIKDINGDKVNSKVFKDKIVMITFWATWCPFCTKEMPTLEKLYQENKGNKNFSIVTVCLNQDAESIPLYAEMNGFNFPILLDPDNKLYKVFRDELKTPVTYLIAKNGNVIGEIVSNAHDWSTKTSLNFFKEISSKGTNAIN